jgi:hypothetical protein
MIFTATRQGKRLVDEDMYALQFVFYFILATSTRDTELLQYQENLDIFLFNLAGDIQ